MDITLAVGTAPKYHVFIAAVSQRPTEPIPNLPIIYTPKYVNIGPRFKILEFPLKIDWFVSHLGGYSFE